MIAPSATTRPRTKTRSMRRRGRARSWAVYARTSSLRAACVVANTILQGVVEVHPEVQSEVIDPASQPDLKSGKNSTVLRCDFLGSEPLQACKAGRIRPRHSPRPMRRKPDASHQPLSITSSPSSRKAARFAAGKRERIGASTGQSPAGSPDSVFPGRRPCRCRSGRPGAAGSRCWCDARSSGPASNTRMRNRSGSRARAPAFSRSEAKPPE